MHNMKRIVSTTLISVLLIALAVPGFSFADSNKGNNDKDKDNGKYSSENFKKDDSKHFNFDKMLKNYEFMDGKKIKVRHKNVNFDVNPVIREGRTLIPVRAITEAMGADVFWDASESTVTITSADGKTIIMFYLGEDDNGKVTVNGTEVTIDVKPGMIQNRTFVPLRFIAETLGFNVKHDDKTREIDCDKDDDKDDDAVINKLSLTPSNVSFSNKEIITDVTTAYSMDSEYDLVSIKNLTAVLAASDYTTTSNKVTIKKGYIEKLTTDKTVLTFVFENSKDVLIEKAFEIKIDQDAVYEKPVISPLGVKYFSDSDIKDAVLTVDLNDHKLTSVKNTTTTPSVLVLNNSYTLDNNKITIKESFIRSLAAGKTVLTFVFEAIDKELVNLDFTIEK